MSDLRDKLEKLVSGDESALLFERVQFERDNKDWLEHSGKIALAVLIALDAQNMSQKAFAEKMGITPQQVSKILQGNENLSLQTIAKMETALGIPLIKVNIDITMKHRKQRTPKKEKH